MRMRGLATSNAGARASASKAARTCVGSPIFPRALAGLMSVAGVIDSRQRQLATRFDDPDELDLVLHVRNEDEPIRLNVKAALDDVLDHLLVHAPHMVIGHDAHLAELWKADPETFARHGRALGGVQAPRPAAPADDTPYGTLFGPATRPVQAPD